MKKLIGPLLAVGCILLIIWALYSLSTNVQKLPVGFFVECSESKCSVYHRSNRGDYSIIVGDLTPSEAEALATKLNADIRK